MDIAKIVAIARYGYHREMLSVVNVANQLHILSDRTADYLNKGHIMTIANDICPRLGLKFEDVINKKEAQ